MEDMRLANINRDLQTYINELITEQLDSQSRKGNNINNRHTVEIKDRTFGYDRDSKLAQTERNEDDV